MLTALFIWLINLTRHSRNLWRRLLRRRVAYVRIPISGALPEFAPAPPWWAQRFFGAQAPLSLSELRRRFEWLASDPQVRGVVLDIGALTCGWATIQSIDQEVRQLRERSKLVVAQVANPDTKSYVAACAADLIVAPPAGLLTVTGLYTEVRFLKDALAKADVRVEVTAVSPYKAAGEPLARSDMSPENREQLERLIDQRYAMIIETIARARRKTADEVRSLIDGAPWSARRAREAGLIDAVLYEDELPAFLASHTGASSTKLPAIAEWDEARRTLRLPMLRRYRRLVGVVAVDGTIAPGRSRRIPLPIPLIGSEIAGSESIVQALRQAERNPRIAAVILYVNSPGGSAFDSDLIWREVRRLDRRKPVVAVMGDVAASGGYYVASGARAILAQPGTITGSIGVLIIRPVFDGLVRRAGVNTVAIGRGANSGFFTSDAPTEQERRATRTLLDESYAIFKQRVGEGRSLTEDALEPLAGGRVWTGSEAREQRLIDDIGGMPEALLKAQEFARLPRDRTAPLVLIGGERGRLMPQPFPNEPLKALMEALDLLHQPRVWALLPFSDE
ncbi:MAG: signal peptide peptidase SppA [Roseiflexus sp.]|nr:signal peptide peptidase SppA [Roseiflexus sp.]MCS7287531.1 signal peptide peptidase SppA [Roseiflexus sp.]MDW8148598.1 signal peptide peptidase SppA [Roseiflexaceae bacterium]MDW8231752.1 signal peptide peptidase SppA [Roseiflexaceae bacterium]